MEIRKNLILLLIFLTPLSYYFSNKSLAAPPSVDFAIYDPGQRGDGVWKPEVDALRKMLALFGWTFETIGFNEINEGYLGEGSNRRFNGLIMPGGYTVPRLSAITGTGKNNIENFVATGGSYIGFCAGAFYASENVVWAEGSSSSARERNLERDYLTYENRTSPDLLPGRAIGPFGCREEFINFFYISKFLSQTVH